MKYSYSIFKLCMGKDIIVELRTDLSIFGALFLIDQHLSIKFTDDANIPDLEKHHHVVLVFKVFKDITSLVFFSPLPFRSVSTMLLGVEVNREKKNKTTKTKMLCL
uniref:Uncharacterized protein n=1 Tax=Mus spicilegus TaxID=10103 RepID=A0A8C6HS48_MUSSI